MWFITKLFTDLHYPNFYILDSSSILQSILIQPLKRNPDPSFNPRSNPNRNPNDIPNSNYLQSNLVILSDFVQTSLVHLTLRKTSHFTL